MGFTPYSFTDETDPLGPPADSGSNTPLDNATFSAMQLAVVSGMSASGTHAARPAASTAGFFYKETDTGIIYRDNGSSWDIWKGDGNVRKTADETVNNSTTLQNDDHLFFPIEVNEVWFASAYLRTQGASANADFKFGWTGPTGATASWAVSGLASTSNFNWSAVATTVANNGALAIGSSSSVGALAGEAPVLIAGWFFADASHAGTIRLQWAQATQTVEDNKILKNSFLHIRRIA